MAEFPVTGLRSVDFVVPDLAAASAFYTDTWGLEVADRSEDTVWLRATGTDPHVLALHAGDGAAMRSMTFRLAADADPEALVAAMVARGATATPAPATHGGGTLHAVRDAQGRTIQLVRNDALAPALAPVADRPERLAHVNFNSDDTLRDAAFFTEALGFSLTDRSKMMAFVRTNSDHHSIVIADASVNTLNHVAFQLPTWEGVMRGSGRLVDHQIPIGWGPGRHGPGNNVFAYFVDPFGFVIEYTADVLQVDETYRVGGPDDWTWPPGRTDHWGIAPPKSNACKAAQLAIPFA
uniref:VOC family protein n=1 Tax=uncultured Sphingomonas sp. TaxID=158754 RepID=UPI0035CA5F47